MPDTPSQLYDAYVADTRHLPDPCMEPGSILKDCFDQLTPLVRAATREQVRYLGDSIKRYETYVITLTGTRIEAPEVWL
jgi:hypothetical protein